MSGNRHFGEPLTNDPDDAPELLAAFFEDAEVREGEVITRPAARGPGRPKAEHPKRQISVRLDADVLTRLRAFGPGWQTQMNALLRAALDAREPSE